MSTVAGKMLSKIHSAIWVRWQIIVEYAVAAPSIRFCFPWLKLAVTKTRLCRGARFGMVTVALDKSGELLANLDTGSSSEMDAFHEVVIGHNYPLEKLPFEPSLVADCGANIGLFSCLARVSFSKATIHAWEAESYNFERLCQQPALRSKSVELHYAAVSDREGHVEMSGGGTGGEIVGEAPESKGVKCIDFAKWWAENSVPRSLLKMDIEGHETRVLPALRGKWKAPCAIFLETHAPRGDDRSLIHSLSSDGFCVELLRTHSLPTDPRVFKEYLAVLS
jgi:FkbM family methyltransferase